ncbi:MAG: hypothetical protein LBI60_00390 [Bacteroidales bacterium]|nr:hypothetical protein [Bacteroidales bacterium]
MDKFHVIKICLASSLWQAVCDLCSRTVVELWKQFSEGRKRTEEDKALFAEIELLRRVSYSITSRSTNGTLK